MTRYLICAFAAALFVLPILAAGFDYSATAKPINQTDREKACQYCYERCGKWDYICRLHCKTRSGCPAPTGVTTDRR
jgi:hypothetical protein